MISKRINMDFKAYDALVKECIEETAATVPASHNRIFEEKKQSLIKKRISETDGKECEIQKGDVLIFTVQKNLGTVKYPHMIEAVDWDYAERVCDKIVITRYGKRPTAERILAFWRS